MNQLLRETLELVRPGMSAAGLILRVEAAPEIPAVHGHASQLQQVILNLLTNAMDATAPGGRVEVATRTEPDRGQVVVEVRDSGQGMGAAERRQIFEPFFSTKEPGRGSGLGLFISAQIVRDHKGADRGGERAGPWQRLPRLPARRRRDRVTAPATLLIADDDPVALACSPRSWRARATSCAPPPAGRPVCELAAREPFELAIVDLRMPDMDGLEVIKRLAVIRPGMPDHHPHRVRRHRHGDRGHTLGRVRTTCPSPSGWSRSRSPCAASSSRKRLARENVQYRQERATASACGT